MGDFVKALRDNAGLLQEFFGRLDDIRASNTYDEYVAELKDEEQRKLANIRFLGLAKRVRDTPFSLDDDVLYNTTEEADYSNATVYGSNAYKEYSTYLNSFTEDDIKNNPTQIQKFDDFVKGNADYKTELKNLGIISDKKTLKSPEEIKKYQYEQAKLTPEEISFFESYKPEDIQQHNYDLSKLAPNYTKLISKGEKQDEFAKLYLNKVEGLGIEDQPGPQWKTHIDPKSGNLVYYDENQPWNMRVSKYADTQSQTKPYSFGADEQIVEYTDETGATKYGIFRPDPSRADYGLKGWKYTGVDATPDQVDKFLKQGKYQVKGPGKKGGPRGIGGPRAINKRTPAELAAMKPEDLATMNLDQLQDLYANQALLSPETAAALALLLKQENLGDKPTLPGQQTDSSKAGNPLLESNLNGVERADSETSGMTEYLQRYTGFGKTINEDLEQDIATPGIEQPGDYAVGDTVKQYYETIDDYINKMSGANVDILNGYNEFYRWLGGLYNSGLPQGYIDDIYNYGNEQIAPYYETLVQQGLLGRK